MLELFQKILKDKLTPNQLLLLYGIQNSTTFPGIVKGDFNTLVKNEFLNSKSTKSKECDTCPTGVKTVYNLTPKGVKICAKYNQYFRVAKKRTSNQLLGKGYKEMLKIYREAFPAGKLPSGKPGRQNIKTLENAFRWFFDTYDYTWDEVAHATVMYVNEYKEKDYLYMKTSQYFICKSDKNKVKHSELADYCDMIRDGVTLEDKKHFKEKVV